MLLQFHMSPKMPPKSRAHNDYEAKRGNVHGDGLAVSASASFSTNEFSNRMSKKEKSEKFPLIRKKSYFFLK